MNAIVKYSEERLMKVLLVPVISEKATMVAEKNEQVVFRVMPDATKLEIKAAVEMLFKVEVLSVQTANRMGKAKRTGKFNGRRNHTKRAFVCLKPGQEINFSEEAA
jgi:large subunit ribosomal protein L23